MQGIIKKIAIPVLMLLSFQTAFAQQPTQEEKKLLFDKVDTLLVNYIRYSRFLEGAALKVTPQAISNFRQLFVSDNATLPDEMSPLFFDTEKAGKKPLLPSGNSFNAEANKLKNKVPVLQAKDTRSNTRLLLLKDSLDSYFNGLNNGRDSFYREYNNLSEKMTGYDDLMELQEAIVDRSVVEFTKMVEENYPDGFSVKLFNSAISFNDIENNNVKVLIRKRTEGKIYGSGVKLASMDTLLLTLQLSQQYSKVLISNIERIGHKLDFLNDNDRDFTANSEDACPDEKGLFTMTGCPDKTETDLKSSLVDYLEIRNKDSAIVDASLKEVNNKISITQDSIALLESKINSRPRWVITLGANAGFVDATFENAPSGYNYDGSNLFETDVNPVSKFSNGNVVGGFAMVERYFGPKNKPANIGIAAGISFSSISGTVVKDTFHVEYKAADKANGERKGGNFYTQIISTAKFEEKVTITNVSVPIMAIYRGDIIEKKLGFKVEAGIAVNLFYNSLMNGSSSTKFDYEAIYKYSSPLPNSENQDYFDPGGILDHDPESWLITKDAAEQRLGKDKVEDYFENMKANKYPVGLGVEPTNFNKSATFKVGVSFMVRPSISFYLGGSSLNIGAYYINTNFSQSGNYRVIDENQNYNTLMQGVSKASNSSYGIHVSYSFPLFYKFSKWTKDLSGLR